jgi:DNA-binding response OmpR family regulator
MTLLLLVDDEALILQTINDALEDGGYATIQAHSGEEAIALLQDAEQTFAGVITDINLGGLNGWEVARAARERSADIPVVYMTGDSAHEWTSHGVPNSVLVPKPFALSQMVTAISQLLNEAATRASGGH